MWRVDARHDRLMAMAAGRLGDLPAPILDFNRIGITARCERKRVEQAVHCFGRVLANKVGRRVGNRCNRLQNDGSI